MRRPLRYNGLHLGHPLPPELGTSPSIDGHRRGKAVAGKESWEQGDLAPVTTPGTERASVKGELCEADRRPERFERRPQALDGRRSGVRSGFELRCKSFANQA